VICAEGYLFALETRGYLSAGPYVPEAVLDHPEIVEQLHRDFVHAGSDIVEALTFYADRDKLQALGREGDLERMNRQALAIAVKVARDTGTIAAGNICNTRHNYEPTAATEKAVRAGFDEQLAWAVDAGVDHIIGETFYYLHEARIGLAAIRATGLPAVINLAIPASGLTEDGVDPADAARRLEDEGAAVVGLNCFRGPATMWPLVLRVREAVSCHVAALPVAYRTRPAEPTIFALTDGACPCATPFGSPFPMALDPFRCTRYELASFARDCVDAGVRFVGVCCGGEPFHIREIAEELGRRPPATRYAPNMTQQPARPGW
jgi:betaine-homocysteine S-methyltransferase